MADHCESQGLDVMRLHRYDFGAVGGVVVLWELEPKLKPDSASKAETLAPEKGEMTPGISIMAPNCGTVVVGRRGSPWPRRAAGAY